MRAYLDLVATCAALAFLLLVAWPAYEYAYEESFITTPALQIPNIWRAAALPVGIGLMALFAFLRLARAGDLRVALGAVLSVALLIGMFWLAQPWLRPLGNINLIIFFVGVAGFCVFTGVPIAFGFGLAIFGYLALTTRTPLMVLVGRMDEGMSHLILLSVPLFVFLGLLIEMTGMARAMVAFLASLLGHVRGGLHYVLVGAMYLVSGISGSKAADMAAVAPVLFPEMKQRGAKPGDLVALLAATGAQTETIPPSLVLITIGSVTGVSIAALFTGGLLPGVVLAITLSALVWWRYRDEDLSHVTRATGGEIVRSFIIALPALALPFVIRAAVVEGIATATEVSTIGIVYGLVVGLLVYRHFDWRRLMPMLVETACLSGAILLIIGTATGMAWGLTQSGFSRALAGAMTGLPGGSATFIAVSIVAFTVLGSVLEGIPAIVLFGPLLFPIARTVGVHEVHYPRHGHRIVRAAVRSRLLCGLRHRPRRSCRGHSPHLGLSARTVDRIDHRGDFSVDLDRFSVSGIKGRLADEWSAKPIQHWFGQDACQFCAADAVELPGAHRRCLSRSYQRRLRGPRLHLGADLCALPAFCLFPRGPKHRQRRYGRGDVAEHPRDE